MDMSISFVATEVSLCQIRARNNSVWDPGPPLQMAPARWDEDRSVRVQRVPVGHSRHVVCDRTLDAITLCDPLVLGGKDLRVLFEMLQQLPEHALRLAVLSFRGTGEIHVLEHELAERV